MKKYCEFLNEEIEFNIIPTEYEINKINVYGKNIDRYSFETIKSNMYSVYFMLTDEDDIIFPNHKHISDYIDINQIPTIYFSLYDRPFDDTFDKLTNKQEFLEVMGKVAYIIRQYMDTHDYDVYTYNSDDRRSNFYSYYWKNFSDFLRLDFLSKNYLDENQNRKKSNILIKDYQRYITESNFIKFSNGAILKMPWAK